MTNVAVLNRTSSVSVLNRTSSVTVQHAGIAGPQGAQGPAGSTTLTVNSGAAISSGQLVAVLDGALYVADITNAAHAGEVVGIATQSAGGAGVPIQVQITGQYADSYAAWVPGAVFVGANGYPSQTPPAFGAGWILEVARAVSATALAVGIKNPILQ